MLIVGGGPAGAAAAVYAARKGIRTGIVAERFGGQTMDTPASRTSSSVLETEGPKLAAALEAHVATTASIMITLQRGCDRARRPRRLRHGDAGEQRQRKGRTVILATSARWRKYMNVPGEAEYRTSGVAYCPHCDGPLFKGKDVAVIGGWQLRRRCHRSGRRRQERDPDRVADQLKADQVL